MERLPVRPTLSYDVGSAGKKQASLQIGSESLQWGLKLADSRPSQTSVSHVTVSRFAQAKTSRRRSTVEFPIKSVMLTLLLGSAILDATPARARHAQWPTRVPKMQDQCREIRLARDAMQLWRLGSAWDQSCQS
jgi:hypothetical protein